MGILNRKKKIEKIDINLKILRRNSSEDEPRWQIIRFESSEVNATVARALSLINNGGYVDTNGNPVEYIRWECSCLQKKCGSCAMVINGVPQLACNAFLKDMKGTVTIEPLRKFRVVADLIADRSTMYENMKTLQVWVEENIKIKDSDIDLAYDASRCLQCGCCLEVCPNFCPGESFFGAAGFVPVNRLISSLSKEEKERIKEEYITHIYNGCGKSLACAGICPAGIEADNMLVNSNGAALWKRK